MPYDGAGNFTRVHDWTQDRTNGIAVNADRMDAEMDGMATGLSTALTKNGQTVVTANIPMATFKFTGLGAGTADNDSVRLKQVTDRFKDIGGALTLAGGTTAYTVTTNQTLSLADGATFTAVVNATSTGAATLNVDALGVKSVMKITAAGEVATVAGDLIANQHAVFDYDVSANAAAGAWILRNPIKAGSGITGNTDNGIVRFGGTEGILAGSTATVTSAGIMSGVRYLSYGTAVALADDTATSFAIDAQSNAMVLITTRGGVGAGAPNGLYQFNPAAPAVALIAGGSTNILLTTGILAGTTGTDANFNISAHTDGNLYLENRMGASRTVNVAVFAIA
jgi:hypothetical protein